MQVGDRFPIAVTIDRSHGSEFLAQRVVRCGPGRSGPPRLEATQDLLYVESGRGTLRDITQFVGLIAPGRAPMHSHIYDEIVYIIDGEGILHLGGQEKVIGPEPPLVEHCLGNTGKGSMRVLGVFHPSGNPASRAYESE